MKKIDISEYLQPDEYGAGTAAQEPDEASQSEPIGDPTYSMVLGYGFTRDPRPRAHKPPKAEGH